jgi:biopolymer transport protein ExbD
MRAYRKTPWSTLTINMTPLFDVVFLMIIFFMTILNFSELLVQEVTLPEADAAEKAKEMTPETVVITILAEDSVVVGGTKITPDSLEALLRKRGSPKTKIQLRGDENVTYDTVQKVMQGVADAGIAAIDLQTRRDEEGASQ